MPPILSIRGCFLVSTALSSLPAHLRFLWEKTVEISRENSCEAFGFAVGIDLREIDHLLNKYLSVYYVQDCFFARLSP